MSSLRFYAFNVILLEANNTINTTSKVDYDKKACYLFNDLNNIANKITRNKVKLCRLYVSLYEKHLMIVFKIFFEKKICTYRELLLMIAQ